MERAPEVAAGKEVTVTKQRGSWRKGYLYCALLGECKWISAVILVCFCKITFCNYLFKEITIRASKGRQPGWHCAPGFLQTRHEHVVMGLLNYLEHLEVFAGFAV